MAVHCFRKRAAAARRRAKISWMIGVALHIDDLRPGAFDQDAATHTAVGAGRFRGIHHLGRLLFYGYCRHLQCGIEKHQACLHFARITVDASYVGLDHAAVVEIDCPVMQRACDPFAVHDALRQRTTLVRTLIA